MKLFSSVLSSIGSACLVAQVASASVTLTLSPIAPVVGTNDVASLDQSGVVPGGTTPGGGAYNQQAFSDNSGPPGQTFTTGAVGGALTAFSFKGAAAASFSYGNFDTGSTWSIRFSSVVGTTLTPLVTVTGIVHPDPNPEGGANMGLNGDNWFTWSFTDVDSITLSALTVYSFEAFSSDNSYQGFDASATDTYVGGFAYNTSAPARSFDGSAAQDRGYDRTFVANLAAVPEPGSVALTVAGLAGVVVVSLRRRRQA